MMCDIWNSKVIKPPLVKTYQSKAHDIDFANVQSLLSDAVKTHTIHNALLVESCIMRRVIYRLKLQFRHDKGFKFFEATNRLLNHFFNNNNISKDLKHFLSFVPQKYEKVVTLPCKQMLEYLLVRLQGYAQVCARIVESSFKCINFMKTRLLLRHQWEIALVAISIASRVWFICRHYTIKCCLLYNNLLPLLEKLKITGEKWLPDLYEFPADLTTWLNYDWLIEIPDIIIQLPVGIPNFILDDDDVEFIGQYNHTYIIPDDNDEDRDDVKFVCNLSNKKLKLNKKQVRHLQSRFVITLDDSGSSDKQVEPSSKFDNIFELLDNDIQIIESKSDDDIVAIDDEIDENANIGQKDFNEAIIENEITKDTVEDQNNDDDDTGESADEENAIISVSEEENEINVKDIGESITRQEIEEQTENEEEEIEYNEDQEDEEYEEEEAEYNEEQRKEEQEEEVEYNEKQRKEEQEEEVEYNEEQREEEQEDEEYVALLTELEETKKRIEMYEDLRRLDTIDKLKCLLKNENLKRKFDEHSRCLFVNIPDNIWYQIAFHIHYFIAMTVANLPNRTKYLIKSRNVLLSIALERKMSAFIPTLKNKMKSVDVSVPMTLKGKEYLINSIDSLSDLQLFIAKEIHKREKSVEKCLFSNYNFNEWTQIYNKMKYLIAMGMKRPIRSNVYLKKAKVKLTQLLLDEDDDSDTSSDSDFEELTQNNNFDNTYKYVTREDSYIELFNYIQDIEDYVYPPNMKTIIIERTERNLENLNAHINDRDGRSPNKRKRTNNSSPQSCKKNSNLNACIYDGDGSLPNKKRKRTNNSSPQSCKKNSNLNACIYDGDGSLPNKKRKRTNNSSPQSCKKNSNLNACIYDGDGSLPNKKRIRANNSSPQSCKKNRNLNAHIYDEDGSLPNKKKKNTNNSSPQSCKKIRNLKARIYDGDGSLPNKKRKNTNNSSPQSCKKIRNLKARIYDGDGSLPNKKRKNTNKSSPTSCKKNRNLNACIYDGNGSLPNKKRKNTNNSSPQSCKKNRNLNARIYDGDGSLQNKKSKSTNNSSPKSCKKNLNVVKEQPLKLTRKQKERKVKKKQKLN